MERGNRRLQYFIVSAVASTAVTCGVSFSWATPVLPKITHDEIGFPLSKEAISWMVSVSSIGYVIGCFLTMLTSDKCGRRLTILGSCLPILTGAIVMTFAWQAWMLSSGRFLWGVGTGMILSVSIIYIAEIADKDIRGQLSLTNRFMLSFGCLLVIVVGAFVSFQTLNYMLLALPILYLIACWWIPESPYYLLKEGKKEAARKTLRMLTGIKDEDILEEKIFLMQSHVKMEMRRSGSVKEFFGTGKRYRKAIFIVVGLKIPQIMTGLHAIQNYLGPILLESKTEINIAVAMIIFGAVRFLLGVMSSVLVDRLGRRPLLVSSFSATGFLLAGIAIYYGIQKSYGTSHSYTLIPFIGILLVVITANLGYESVAYIIPAELFPINVKSIAFAMITALGGFMNFLAVKSYQQIKDSVGLFGIFSIYATAAFIGALFCYFVVPETKGKSLKEIQIELNGNIYDEEEKLNVAASYNKSDIANNGTGNLGSEERDFEK